MYDGIVHYINFFKAHCAKSGDRPSEVPAFQKVSMEVNESQKDVGRRTDPCPPDSGTEPAKR
jgi:hypothetical protein